MTRRVAAALLVALAIGGCADGGGEVTGIVVEVRGDLERVDSFVLRTDAGEVLEFELADVSQLDSVLSTLLGVEAVYDAYRVVPGGGANSPG